MAESLIISVLAILLCLYKVTGDTSVFTIHITTDCSRGLVSACVTMTLVVADGAPSISHVPSSLVSMWAITSISLHGGTTQFSSSVTQLEEVSEPQEFATSVTPWSAINILPFAKSSTHLLFSEKSNPKIASVVKRSATMNL